MRFIGILILLLCFSCEDVIEVDLPEQPPRLIIDALIEVEETDDCVQAQVKTSLSANFYGKVDPVSVTSVKVYVDTYNEYGDVETTFIIQFDETEVGLYEQCLAPTLFDPARGYYLAVTYGDRFYLGKTTFATSTTLNSVEVGEESSFFNEDATEVIINFTDVEDEKNFYLLDYGKGNFSTLDDIFINGQDFTYSIFLGEEYDDVDELEIKLLGANQEFYNYMSLLEEQSNRGDSPFETPAATIRGNMFDFTDIDNRDQFDNTGATDTFPLGYFAIVESDSKTISLN